jgi:RNA polymerase sigma-70 factor (ECF subfamily)
MTDAQTASAAPAGPFVVPAPQTDDLGADSRLAAEVKGLVAAGNHASARELFGDLVQLHQRRANRIAYAYLRNAADADEAVQDAFLRVFAHIDRYREELPFDQWFTRILVNGCIDRHRSRERRERRLVPIGETTGGSVGRVEWPDGKLTAREWREAVTDALAGLPDRQRAVFTLCHYGDRTPAEVSAMLGLRESTVRVHLFRAVHKLRAALGAWREAR